VINRYFSTVIFVVIFLNTVILVITWYDEPKGVTTTVMILNYVFSFIFVAETIMKLIGLGFKEYFKDKWNQFDFIVVLVSIIAEIAA